jgi:hypothetical protein
MERQLRKKKGKSRPYETRYYTDTGAKEGAYSSQGWPVTPATGLRSAFFRIFIGEYSKAYIYDRETGAVVYSLKRTPDGNIRSFEGVDSPRLRLIHKEHA